MAPTGHDFKLISLKFSKLSNFCSPATATCRAVEFDMLTFPALCFLHPPNSWKRLAATACSGLAESSKAFLPNTAVKVEWRKMTPRAQTRCECCEVSIFGPGRLLISGVLSASMSSAQRERSYSLFLAFGCGVSLRLRWLCWGVALGFCGFGAAQLLRLQLSGLLCWSPKLGKFADPTTLAAGTPEKRRQGETALSDPER